MAPCPLHTHTALLSPLASWCLDTFGEGPPMLVGVSLGERVTFHPVFLDEHDPIDDLAELVAPDGWDAIVVVVPSTDVDVHVRRGTVAHAVDRSGASATELDDRCGHRRTLRAIGGRLHSACVGVLVSLP